MKIFNIKSYARYLLPWLLGSSLFNGLHAEPMTTMNDSSMQGGSAPADARDPYAYSDGFEYRGMAGWEETDKILFGKFLAERLEFGRVDNADTLTWDIQSWWGGDYKKLWMKLEGDDEVRSNTGELELQLLYSQALDPFWDYQIGVRYDTTYGNPVDASRSFAVLALQGLAPYWFETEASLYISEDGDISARFLTSYDLLLTQRLILQPRFEINVAASEVTASGVGKGINNIELGLRLRYEIKREIAPYIGVNWFGQFGDTADFSRAGGESTRTLTWLAGLRLWF